MSEQRTHDASGLLICQHCGVVLKTRSKNCRECGSVTSRYSTTVIPVLVINRKPATAPQHLKPENDPLIVERVVVRCRFNAAMTPKSRSFHGSRAFLSDADQPAAKGAGSDAAEASLTAPIPTANRNSVPSGPGDFFVASAQTSSSAPVTINESGSFRPLQPSAIAPSVSVSSAARGSNIQSQTNQNVIAEGMPTQNVLPDNNPGQHAADSDLFAISSGEDWFAETPAQNSLAQSEPTQSVAGLADPLQTDVVQNALAQSGSIQSGAGRGDPAQTDVVQNALAQSGSIQSGAGLRDPAQTGVVQNAAAQSGSVQSGAGPGDPAQTERNDLAQTGSTQSGAGLADHANTDVVQNALAQGSSTQSGADTAQTDVVHNSPAQTDITQSGVGQTEPAPNDVIQNDLTRTDPMQDVNQSDSAQNRLSHDRSQNSLAQISPAQINPAKNAAPATTPAIPARAVAGGSGSNEKVLRQAHPSYMVADCFLLVVLDNDGKTISVTQTIDGPEEVSVFGLLPAPCDFNLCASQVMPDNSVSLSGSSLSFHDANDANKEEEFSSPEVDTSVNIDSRLAFEEGLSRVAALRLQGALGRTGVLGFENPTNDDDLRKKFTRKSPASGTDGEDAVPSSTADDVTSVPPKIKERSVFKPKKAADVHGLNKVDSIGEIKLHKPKKNPLAMVGATLGIIVVGAVLFFVGYPKVCALLASLGAASGTATAGGGASSVTLPQKWHVVLTRGQAQEAPPTIYQDFDIDVAQSGNTFTGKGRDGIGDFTLTGEIGKDSSVSMQKQYDTAGYIWPILFSGLVAQDQNGSFAKGTYAWHKSDQERVQGDWQAGLPMAQTGANPMQPPSTNPAQSPAGSPIQTSAPAR